MALHQALGNDPFVMRHGVRRALKGIGGRDVFYVLFPNTAQPGQRLDAASIEGAARPLLNRFGGLERLKECARTSPVAATVAIADSTSHYFRVGSSVWPRGA